MTTPQRPFWKRKRWVAAGVLWLAVAYPLALVPFGYLDGLGFIPRPVGSVIEAAYAPIMVFDGTPLGDTAENLYRLGRRLGGR